jgi:integrase/recombinase XerD
MNKTDKYQQLQKEFAIELQELETYLKKQGYGAGTIQQIRNYAACYLSWLKSTGTTQTDATYNDLLIYIGCCRDDGNSTRQINQKLNAIRKYYSYLQYNDETIKNPASGLYLKGTKRGIPNNLIEKEELQKLYNCYQVYDLRTARNKVILSLLINQALTTGELHMLEPEHINLKSCTIEIPGTNHSNGRRLKLEASQIIELYEYLTDIRPAILETITSYPKCPGRKSKDPDLERLNSQLIISMNGSANIKNSLKHMINALKKINPKIRDCRQIRHSVIAQWLKNEDVRKVQYKAGHRYVSTTERYQVNNLEDLQEALKLHHPLSEEA